MKDQYKIEYIGTISEGKEILSRYLNSYAQDYGEVISTYTAACDSISGVPEIAVYAVFKVKS